jgi:hypothetical protein
VSVDRNIAATWRHQRKISISLINSLPGKNCLVRDRAGRADSPRRAHPQSNPNNAAMRLDAIGADEAPHGERMLARK